MSLRSAYFIPCAPFASPACPLGAENWFYKGSYNDTEWHSITFGANCSGILLFGSQYIGYGIYNIAYNKKQLIGGTDISDNVDVENYTLKIKHGNFIFFKLHNGGVN